VLLGLTRKTAALTGENPAEWAASRKPWSLGAVDVRTRTDAERRRAVLGQARRGGAGGRRAEVKCPPRPPHPMNPGPMACR
jgi:hypothetical protein